MRRFFVLLLLVSLPANDVAAAAHWHAAADSCGVAAPHWDGDTIDPQHDQCSECQFLATFVIAPIVATAVRYEISRIEAIASPPVACPSPCGRRPEKPPR